MKDLKQLQSDFADYLKGNRDSAIHTDIVGDEKASVEERMGFYHDAYRLRLIEVLSNDYPVVAKLLGEEEFAKMALAYLRTYPSKYRSVRWFGVHLPEFLKKHDQDTETSQQLLEIAEFEKAQNDVFDERAINVVVLDELAAIDPLDWGDMRISLIPAVRILTSHYNIGSVWVELFKRDDETIEPQTASWERQDYPTTWLVWRSGMDPKWRTLEVDEAFAVFAFQKGQSFGEICSGLTEWLDEEHVPLRAASILKTLILDGIVSTIEEPGK